jgi:hypothetical protein
VPDQANPKPEGSRYAMYEIIAVSQLANALRYEVSEMFVSGQLAIQIHRVMTKKRSLQEWRTLYRNIFDLLQTQYDIVTFDDSDSVPYLLLRRKSIYFPSISTAQKIRPSCES